jgi:hypothetical protein
MRTHAKTNGKSSQPARKRRQIVRELAALGHSADVIGAVLGVGRDALRASHALDLQAGRQIKAAEKAASAPPRDKAERERARLRKVIEDSFKSHWVVNGKNLLFWDARSVEEALELCERFGRI